MGSGLEPFLWRLHGHSGTYSCLRTDRIFLFLYRKTVNKQFKHNLLINCVKIIILQPCGFKKNPSVPCRFPYLWKYFHKRATGSKILNWERTLLKHKIWYKIKTFLDFLSVQHQWIITLVWSFMAHGDDTNRPKRQYHMLKHLSSRSCSSTEHWKIYKSKQSAMYLFQAVGTAAWEKIFL